MLLLCTLKANMMLDARAVSRAIAIVMFQDAY